MKQECFTLLWGLIDVNSGPRDSPAFSKRKKVEGEWPDRHGRSLPRQPKVGGGGCGRGNPPPWGGGGSGGRKFLIFLCQ